MPPPGKRRSVGADTTKLQLQRTQAKRRKINGNTNRKEQNRHVFAGFAERIKTINATVTNNHEYLDTLSDESLHTSYLLQECRRWRLENRTADFDAALRELLPLVRTMPHILHHLDKICSIFVRHLRKEKSLALEPLLGMLPVLARDTRGELMPYFVDTIFGTLVWLLETRLEDPDAMEWIFQCMGYLFKYLSSYLLADVATFASFVSQYEQLLSHKRAYIRQFASESLAYLLRRSAITSSERTQGSFGVVLELSLKSPQLSDSVAIVITEACKGVGTTFHTKAGSILQTMLQWTRYHKGNTPTPDDEGDDDASSYPLMVNVFKRLLLTCHSSLPLLLANFGDLLLEGLPPVREVDEWVCLLEVFGTLGKATTLTTVEDGDDTEHSSSKATTIMDLVRGVMDSVVDSPMDSIRLCKALSEGYTLLPYFIDALGEEGRLDDLCEEVSLSVGETPTLEFIYGLHHSSRRDDDDDDSWSQLVCPIWNTLCSAFDTLTPEQMPNLAVAMRSFLDQVESGDVIDISATQGVCIAAARHTASSSSTTANDFAYLNLVAGIKEKDRFGEVVYTPKVAKAVNKALGRLHECTEPAIQALCIRLCPQSEVEKYAAIVMKSVECGSGSLEALGYRGWIPHDDDAIASLINACADTRGAVREGALSLLLARFPHSTPISSALSMEATGPLGIDTERERMIRIGRLAEAITTNTEATKEEIAISAKILVAEYTVPLSTLWPAATTALSELVSDDPNGTTAGNRRGAVWQALKESIQSVWALPSRPQIKSTGDDDDDEQMSIEEGEGSMADRALIMAKAAEDDRQLPGPSTRHQQLCTAIAAVIGASPHMRKEKSEENEWLVNSCLDVLKRRYEYDTVTGPTATVSQVSDLLDCLLTVAKDRAFICSEATEGELSRMAVEHLLGDSSLGHNKRRADMATIGLQILLQSRQWRDALKRYKKEILMLTDDKTFRDGLLKIPLGEGGESVVEEEEGTINRIADEDRSKVVTVIYRILLGKISAKGGGIDKHGQTQATRRGQILTYIAGGRVDELGIFLDAMEAPLNSDLRKCCIGYLKALKDVQKAVGVRLGMHVPRIAKRLVTLWGEVKGANYDAEFTNTIRKLIVQLLCDLLEKHPHDADYSTILLPLKDDIGEWMDGMAHAGESSLVLNLFLSIASHGELFHLFKDLAPNFLSMIFVTRGNSGKCLNDACRLVTLLLRGGSEAAGLFKIAEDKLARRGVSYQKATRLRRRRIRRQQGDDREDEQDDGAELRALEEEYSDALKEGEGIIKEHIDEVLLSIGSSELGNAEVLKALTILAPLCEKEATASTLVELLCSQLDTLKGRDKRPQDVAKAAASILDTLVNGGLLKMWTPPTDDTTHVSGVLTRGLSTVAGLGTRHQIALALAVVYRRMGRTDNATEKVSGLLEQLTAVNKLGGEPDFDKQVDGLNLILGPPSDGLSAWWWVQAPVLRHMLWQLREPTCDFGVRRLIEDALCKCGNDRSEDTTVLALVRGLIIPWTRKLLDHPSEVVVNSGIRIIAAYCTNMAPFAVAQGWDRERGAGSSTKDESGSTWADLLHVELMPLAEQGTLDDLFHLQKSRQHKALVRILALEDELSKSTISHLLLPLARYHITNSPDDHNLVDVSTGIMKLAAKDLSWTRVIGIFRWLGGQLKPGGVSRKGLRNRGIGRHGVSPEQMEKALLKGVSAAVQGISQRDDLSEKIGNLKSTVLPMLRRLVYTKQKVEDEAGAVGNEKQAHHGRGGQQDVFVTIRVSMVSAMLEVLSLMDADVFGSEFNKLTGVVVGGLLSRELEDRRKARDALSRMAAAATSLKQITFMLRTIRTRMSRGGYQTPVAVFTASKIIDSATLKDGEGVESFLKEVMGMYGMEEARWLSMQGRAESTQGTEENPMLAKQVSEAARPKANAILEAVGKAMPIEKVLDGLMKPLYGRLIGTELDDVREGAWSSQHAGGVGGARFARRVRTSMLQLTTGILASHSPIQQCQRILTRAVSVLEDKCSFEEVDLFSASAAIIDPATSGEGASNNTRKSRKEEAVTVLPGAATGRGAWVAEEWKKGSGASTRRYDNTIRGSAAAEVGLKLLEGLLKKGSSSTASLLSDEETLRGILSPIAYFITVSKVDDVFVPAARSLSRLISSMKYTSVKGGPLASSSSSSSSSTSGNNPLLDVLSAKETLGIVRSVLKMVQFYSAGASLSKDLTVVQATRQQSTHSSAASSIVATCTKLLCSLLTGTVGIIKCNEELLLALLAHVELCVSEHPKLRMSAMTMLRRVIMPRVSPPSEASTKRTKNSGKAGHSQLVVQLYSVCNVVLENLLCGAGGTYYNDDALGALCGQIVSKWLIDYPHTTQSLTAKIASLVRVAAACANSPNPTCAPPTRRYSINALHSLALQMPAEVLKEFSLMMTLTGLAGAAGETDDRCRSMLRELVKVVVEKVHLRATLRGKVISWSKADQPKLLGAFGEFCLTCADPSDAGIVPVLREAVIRLGQISSPQQLTYWHTLYELLIAFEAGGYHKSAVLDDTSNAFMQLSLGPAGTQAPHPWVRLAALRIVTEYSNGRSEWTIPESAIDSELLTQFGDPKHSPTTDTYVPEGAIPRLTTACYSPFAGEHPEVASATVRATVAVLSCAQRDQNSRVEVVSEEEEVDEEEPEEVEIDDTDIGDTEEDSNPLADGKDEKGDDKTSSEDDDEADLEDVEGGDMGLLVEHEKDAVDNGDLTMELPPESSERVPPRLRWLLVRTSYETRKLLAAYKRSGGIVRLGALLKLVCASAVLVTPDVLCSDEAGLLKPLLSTLVRISSVRPAQEGEDQIGQASSLTDLAKLRPYTGIRRVCAIANQAVESMGKWIRKAGGATLYNKWNKELVEMRGIVVRSRQRRKADEKADAIVHPQETAERKLAKRAVKVEKRKRAMKEKVQEWRGLKQRKL